MPSERPENDYEKLNERITPPFVNVAWGQLRQADSKKPISDLTAFLRRLHVQPILPYDLPEPILPHKLHSNLVQDPFTLTGLRGIEPLVFPANFGIRVEESGLGVTGR